MAREIMTMIVNCETQQNTKVILPRDVMNVELDYCQARSRNPNPQGPAQTQSKPDPNQFQGDWG